MWNNFGTNKTIHNFLLYILNTVYKINIIIFRFRIKFNNRHDIILKEVNKKEKCRAKYTHTVFCTYKYIIYSKICI